MTTLWLRSPTWTMCRPRWSPLRRLYRGYRTGKIDQRTRNQNWGNINEASRSSYGHDENHDRFIHKFPPETVSHIFIDYGPPSTLFDKDDRNTPISRCDVPEMATAWATPQLSWSSLLVEFLARGRYNYSNQSDLPQLVTEWLKQSGFNSALDDMGNGLAGPGITYLYIKARWWDLSDLISPSRPTKMGRLLALTGRKLVIEWSSATFPALSCSIGLLLRLTDDARGIEVWLNSQNVSCGWRNNIRQSEECSRVACSLDEPKVFIFIVYLYLLPGVIPSLSDMESRQNGCKG